MLRKVHFKEQAKSVEAPVVLSSITSLVCFQWLSQNTQRPGKLQRKEFMWFVVPEAGSPRAWGWPPGVGVVQSLR